MPPLRERLQIPLSALEAINALWSDPSIRILDEFLEVVARYGTPEESTVNIRPRAAWKTCYGWWQNATPNP